MSLLEFLAPEVNREPTVADPPDGTVVMLIGMRINKFWMVHRWLPAFLSMMPMIIEVNKNKDHGYLHSRTWIGRTIIMVQYWRTMDELMKYAHNLDAKHRPGWARYNRDVRNDGAVGVFHEAYVIDPSRIHTVYRNMPLMGLARATEARPQRVAPPVPGHSRVPEE